MAQKRTFRDLVVWRKSILLAKAVYATTQRMPNIERFGLISQMRRAVVSIASNIAEGSARQSRRDYVHFLMIARGSLAELETQLIIAQELNFVTQTEELTQQMHEVSRMLQALITKLKSRDGRD